MIEVEDSGPGIAEIREIALVRSVRHHQEDGTGLGLALVAKIVVTIAASSSATAGPQNRVSRPPTHARDRPTGAHQKRRLIDGRVGTILIADDDAAIRTVLNQALARAGYSPRATGNAATLWALGVSKAKATS